ncbi:DUF2285 domain-containing protein [Gluconacetobacter diazotrophicus]|uniref:DUF2285 domain-containing protein n=1 Tax=Gluconacetobacter diazotrophicus TaxID=33996 RepID=UPI00217FC55B|nr:DUF2285 domain-containing protein [Gluconacetobacter diazotrophicus]
MPALPSTPRLPASVSLGDGGYAFAHDPALPVGPEPVAWLPELSPGTLLLDEAPRGFEHVSLDPSQLGTIIADRADDEGREVIVVDDSGELHIRLRSENAAQRPMILLPADLASFDLRLAVASRFMRRLGGQTIGLLPQALRLTMQRKRRLVELLHAFDVHDLGGGPRDVADLILHSAQARLPSVEWKDSHARRAANRLIHDSIALVNRGYLKLLRGG